MSCPSIGRGITNKLLPGRDSVTPINLPLAHGRPLPLVLWPRGDFMLSIQPGAPTSGPSGCVQRRREKVSQESPVPTAGREMVWPAGGAFSYQDPWLCSNKHPSPPTILCEKASRSSRDASQATGVTEGLKMPAVQLGLQGPRSCLQTSVSAKAKCNSHWNSHRPHCSSLRLQPPWGGRGRAGLEA